MIAQAHTWWIVTRISLEERLAYRGDFALGTLVRFLPIITQIFLWGAIFEAIDVDPVQSVEEQRFTSLYKYNDMVAYYLLTMISRAFSSMPGLATGIATTIRNGEIKKFMIQPIDMVSFLLCNRLAHKLVYYVVAAGPFALVFFLCRGYFSGWPAPEILLAFVSSLLMSFLLGYFLESAIGMIGFWFLEVSSLLFIYMLFNFFFSGHMFPIDILPEWCVFWVRLLPLQYLAYFPAAVFLGKIQGAELAWGLAAQAAWIVFFFAVCRVAFARGVRRYSAFGG
jgi:ABC-2 type transport system permease protein